jgi:ABC-type sugar transport system permease subunit
MAPVLGHHVPAAAPRLGHHPAARSRIQIGPANSTTTLAIWSYREAFGTGQPDLSPAAAVGNILIVIALIFGFLYLRIQRRQENS